jgi:23S rRNA pseudouridine2605 synthase
MNAERLQKVLAKSGYGSRRSCESLILDGRVKVNGKRAELGCKVDPKIDLILVDGEKIRQQERLVYIALNKPRGIISSTESQDGRETVIDLVNVKERVYPVGRLDFDSEGLILLTNDGRLTNKITHPRFGHEKEYRVLVGKHPDREQLVAWRRGLILPDGSRSLPAKVYVESESRNGVWLRVTMREGRKRQIREAGALLGLPVRRIIRVRIGNLSLGELKPKQWRYLSNKEVNNLLKGK